jgi:GDP-L-fucose synthase
MIILVTGGSGLIGQALQDFIKTTQSTDNWIFLSSKECNLLNYDETLKILSSRTPDVVIHLAARVGGLYNNMNNNESMYVDNMRMNLNIIEACEKTKVKRFIAVLSTCIFPDKPPSLPLTEEMIHSGPPHYSNEGYAMAKRMLEVHARLSPMETICLIPTNLYGPYDNFKIEDAHVIPALIHKCYIAKQTNQPFKIAGSGKAVRQFLYNADMAKIIQWAVYKSSPSPSNHNSYNDSYHESYICAPNETDEVTIETVAQIIAKTMNYEDQLQFDTSFQEGQYKKTASNKKLLEAMSKNALEFSNFEEKLQSTIEWFINNYEILRK